jgi:hypothetical protein
MSQQSRTGYHAWVESPINIAIRYMIPYDDTRVKGLALDFAEHVLVECDSGIRQRALLAKLIDVGRKYQSGGGHLQPELLDAYQTAKETVDKAHVEWSGRRWPLESEYAAQTVRDALRVIEFEEHRPSELYYAVTLAETARIAVAPPGENFEKDATVAPSMINELKYDEMRWQIRRFIDVMNASQAGENWPPIEATP